MDNKIWPGILGKEGSISNFWNFYSTENWNTIVIRLDTAEDRIIYLKIKSEDIIETATQKENEMLNMKWIDMKCRLWWFNTDLFRV